ncbi:clan AA aspartic protease [Phormidium pseudopriestleyi FRX01]|uniref:Clan AA aspartic protease n=1 Tax=Phormidium pseudopriestleyi FRX01 TaxID=1759528 RepID=A0ABS3FTC8_9CYAN|nr:clan AA aspartic protease [Phormidium pseudopriestleyi]MBO0349856.1 clan AA aspartic protease [Phormidium pseudopriestleyi FRX01]
MMQGRVNRKREAIISIVIANQNRQSKKRINAVIDTGYSGFLTLPNEIITALSLPWAGVERGTLGDGSEVTFDVYGVKVIWDGTYRDIPVCESETDPLVGMRLLYGYDLQIQAIEGGLVTIQTLD